MNTVTYLGCGQGRILQERSLSEVYDVDVVVAFHEDTIQSTSSNLGLILGVIIASSVFVVLFATYRIRNTRNKKILAKKVHVLNPLNHTPVAVPWTNTEPWKVSDILGNSREQFQPLHIRGRSHD